jgi:DNA-binding transcriptional LysR family regulator
VIFDELRQSVGEIEFMANPTVGELCIGCTDPMLSGLLPVVISRLSDRHPRLTFRVSQAPSGAALYREVRERNVDLAIGVAAVPITEMDLNHEILFDERPFVVTGARSPWARRRSIKLVELMDARWALSSSESASGGRFAEVFRACELQMPAAAVFSTSIQLYSALAATGGFLTFLPQSVLWFGPKCTAVKVLPVRLPAIPWPVEIATLKNRTISPVAQLFIECAREIAKPLAKGRSKSAGPEFEFRASGR